MIEKKVQNLKKNNINLLDLKLFEQKTRIFSRIINFHHCNLITIPISH